MGTYVPKSKQKIPSDGEGVNVRPKRNIKRPQSSREMGANSDKSDESTDVDYYFSDEDESSECKDTLDVDDFDSEEESDSEGVHPFDIKLKRGNGEGDDGLKNIYKNGRMYTPKRWGEIVLKPWLMFMSKGDFLSVLSDYCVQEGFSVVVLKFDKHRYTAEYSGQMCTWKIHSSCLRDSITWAIKSVTGVHKECFNIKRNPMETVS
ncbi:hypothetical protein RND81_12G204600 [Saponaria officinalis]|uniref:Transposase MuDR plant domain-containing protein n=1 Tax=Saponaria officinalis TaxID=3572 RepID=A0AAW1HD55_SAPOF